MQKCVCTKLSAFAKGPFVQFSPLPQKYLCEILSPHAILSARANLTPTQFIYYLLD